MSFEHTQLLADRNSHDLALRLNKCHTDDRLARYAELWWESRRAYLDGRPRFTHREIMAALPVLANHSTLPLYGLDYNPERVAHGLGAASDEAYLRRAHRAALWVHSCLRSSLSNASVLSDARIFQVNPDIPEWERVLAWDDAKQEPVALRDIFVGLRSPSRIGDMLYVTAANLCRRANTCRTGTDCCGVDVIPNEDPANVMDILLPLADCVCNAMAGTGVGCFEAWSSDPIGNLVGFCVCGDIAILSIISEVANRRDHLDRAIKSVMFFPKSWRSLIPCLIQHRKNQLPLARGYGRMEMDGA